LTAYETAFEAAQNPNRGRTFARGSIRPDGRFQLDLSKNDNSEIGYRYIKLPTALGLTLYESLRKHLVPREQLWGGDKKFTYVYFLDPLRFEEFKAELDAGGEYYQADRWTEDKEADGGAGSDKHKGARCR
jgi:hypothetical protein